MALHHETRLVTLIGERGQPLVISKSHDVGQPLVRVVDGRCGLLMVGADCRWQVRVIDGRYVVAGWLLASLVINGSLGGVGLLVGSSLGSLVDIGSSFGATHCWAVLLASGRSWWWLFRCGGHPRCGSRCCGSSRHLLFSRYLSF